MLLQETVALLNAKLVINGNEIAATKPDISHSAFANITIDSRQIKGGELFIAIKGENFDGHDFIGKAQELGAIAAVVSQPGANVSIPQLVVPNTVTALCQLGAWKRKQFSGIIFAITGSCGKTTTKQLLSSILSCAAPTLASIKSFNNNIGVPLTLWQLNPEQHRYAVLEAGANHLGEIAELTHLIQPNIAIITNAAPSHLEGFGSMQNIARAKGEIFAGLSATQQTPPSPPLAILNADDEFCAYWRNLVNSNQPSTRIITFGIDNHADVMAQDIHINRDNHPEFSLIAKQETCPITLPLLGEHNITNALAAAAAALSAGIAIAVVKQGLENCTTASQRLVVKSGYAGAKIIDDSYNATPKAVAAALRTLAHEHGTKIFVFADMLELGEESEKWHEYVGKVAREVGIDKVYTYGERAQVVAEMFARSGEGKEARAFRSQEELIAALKPMLDKDCVILVKGSHSMKMEEVVKILAEN